MFKAIKVETEAEGSSWENIEDLRRVSRIQGLPLYLKIGGPEAKTDAFMARERNVDGLIAPMVESAFAAEKFANLSRDMGFSWLGITIETVTALRNLSEIAELARDSGISGLTLGRGDFAASAKIRGREDSDQMLDYAKEFIDVAGGFNLKLGLGGNLQESSIHFSQKLGERLDFIESRRVVISNTFDLEDMRSRTRAAIEWEISQVRAALEVAQGNSEKVAQTLSLMSKRIEQLKGRLDSTV
jgi:hypothetical protein